ncbi:uncharacterized protein MELLADRAFT_104582 [Melampsora larici-populina 98AG31]|uniref:Uncharacterized protein n=1 Tax=Melampsora larici-populina (strain 98AG31 / pathotype 3-4-7) TaxID=747676 RepID=F4RF75_MELLP|nr:uncharacterized protein MELLADRAFT_104582 [Melampsora larici-populina 98AG31]EGG08983.1 hypothetical protein MELLADRAFT_104582 [Melampsora larici-populina 98AG31]
MWNDCEHRDISTKAGHRGVLDVDECRQMHDVIRKILFLRGLGPQSLGSKVYSNVEVGRPGLGYFRNKQMMLKAQVYDETTKVIFQPGADSSYQQDDLFNFNHINLMKKPQGTVSDYGKDNFTQRTRDVPYSLNNSKPDIYAAVHFIGSEANPKPPLPNLTEHTEISVKPQIPGCPDHEVLCGRLLVNKPITKTVWQRTQDLINVFLTKALFAEGINQDVYDHGFSTLFNDWGQHEILHWNLAHTIKLDFDNFCVKRQAEHPNQSSPIHQPNLHKLLSNCPFVP